MKEWGPQDQGEINITLGCAVKGHIDSVTLYRSLNILRGVLHVEIKRLGYMTLYCEFWIKISPSVNNAGAQTATFVLHMSRNEACKIILWRLWVLNGIDYQETPPTSPYTDWSRVPSSVSSIRKRLNSSQLAGMWRDPLEGVNQLRVNAAQQNLQGSVKLESAWFQEMQE